MDVKFQALFDKIELHWVKSVNLSFPVLKVSSQLKKSEFKTFKDFFNFTHFY